MTEDSNMIARQILNYLEEHPSASDTLEGISTWWVQQQQLNESINAVQGALQKLKEQGIIKEQKTPGGRTLYRLDK